MTALWRIDPVYAQTPDGSGPRIGRLVTTESPDAVCMRHREAAVVGRPMQADDLTPSPHRWCNCGWFASPDWEELMRFFSDKWLTPARHPLTSLCGYALYEVDLSRAGDEVRPSLDNVDPPGTVRARCFDMAGAVLVQQSVPDDMVSALSLRYGVEVVRSSGGECFGADDVTTPRWDAWRREVSTASARRDLVASARFFVELWVSGLPLDADLRGDLLHLRRFAHFRWGAADCGDADGVAVWRAVFALTDAAVFGRRPQVAVHCCRRAPELRDLVPVRAGPGIAPQATEDDLAVRMFGW